MNTYDLKTVMTYAVSAHFQNGEEYINYGSKTNKAIIQSHLGEISEPHMCFVDHVTEESATIADKIIQYYKGLTFKILQGKRLSEFENNAMVFANRDVIESNYEIAVIASLPSCHERAVKRDNDVRKLENATGGHIGSVGQKVKVNVEVVRSSFSQQYNVYFISGVTTDNQALFFSYKQPIDAGKLIIAEGTVKRHGENTTQLNRVKVK